MKKRIFCFDFDDTLVDEDYWFRSRWKKTFKIHKEIFSPAIIKDFFSIFDAKGPYHKHHLQDLFSEHKELSLFKEKIIHTFKTVVVKESLFPGARELLHELSSFPNSRIGLVSNGDFKTLIKRLEALNIKFLFETIICDNYMKKPNHESFLTISNNYKDYELYFIGNDIELDLIPAKQNGFEVFLFTKDKKNSNSQYNCFFDYYSFKSKFL